MGPKPGSKRYSWTLTMGGRDLLKSLTLGSSKGKEGRNTIWLIDDLQAIESVTGPSSSSCAITRMVPVASAACWRHTCWRQLVLQGRLVTLCSWGRLRVIALQCCHSHANVDPCTDFVSQKLKDSGKQLSSPTASSLLNSKRPLVEQKMAWMRALPSF